MRTRRKRVEVVSKVRSKVTLDEKKKWLTQTNRVNPCKAWRAEQSQKEDEKVVREGVLMWKRRVMGQPSKGAECGSRWRAGENVQKAWA